MSNQETAKGIAGLVLWVLIGLGAWWFFWGGDSREQGGAAVGQVRSCEVVFLENSSHGNQRRLRAFVYSDAETLEDRTATAIAAALNLRDLAPFDYGQVLLTPLEAPRDRDLLPMSSATAAYAPDPERTAVTDVIWEVRGTDAPFSETLPFATMTAVTPNDIERIASQVDREPCTVSLHWSDETPAGFDFSDLSTEAGIICQNFVDANLAAPATADHPWLDRQIIARGPWRYTVRSYVDAQNGYGAMVRNRYHCEVRYSGSGNDLDPRNWSLERLSFLP